MQRQKWWLAGIGLALAAGLLAQTPGAAAPSKAGAQAAMTPQQHEAVTQDLAGYLRMSPRLNQAVAADPSLLADGAYVNRSNPAAATFLAAHPEIVRNPDFYVEPASPQDNHQAARILDDLYPFLVFLVVAYVLSWMLRAVLDNRRWNRMLRVHTDAHNRLLEKFGNSEELLAYMNTDAGRRFLEAAPLAAGLEAAPRAWDAGWPGAGGRVLLPLQIGIVLTLAGAALLWLRSSLHNGIAPLTVFGTLGVAIGIGFILSAAAAFLIARHLGMLPRLNPESTAS